MAATDKDGRTALMLAAENGHADVAKLLEAAARERAEKPDEPQGRRRRGGADGDHNGGNDMTARDELNGLLSKALKVRNERERDMMMLELLREFNRLAAMDGNMMAALEYTFGEEVAHVDATSAAGAGTLVLAAALGLTDQARALIDAGADVNAVDGLEGVALMSAATLGHTAVLQALVKAGADVNAATGDGGTALMYAAQGGHAAAVKALVKAGANVNATHKDGRTALMLAAENGHADVVNLLEAAARERAEQPGNLSF